MIVLEISKQATSKSLKTTNHQRKVTNSMVFQVSAENFECIKNCLTISFQILIVGTTVFPAILLQIRNAFVEPEEDTRGNIWQ